MEIKATDKPLLVRFVTKIQTYGLSSFQQKISNEIENTSLEVFHPPEALKMLINFFGIFHCTVCFLLHQKKSIFPSSVSLLYILFFTILTFVNLIFTKRETERQP